jgi:DNA-binding CsgD family transcriptional regulator
MPHPARPAHSAEQSPLATARSAFDRQAWTEAYAEYRAADACDVLEPVDVERFANAAFLIGHGSECWELAERAHHAYLERGDIERAAWCAYWLGFGLMTTEGARSTGWLSRARRVLDDANCDCAVRGYLLIPNAVRLARTTDPATAYVDFERALEIGKRFSDETLVLYARHGMGRSLVRLGRIEDGLALLDEVMVAITSKEILPMIVGGIYCSAIAGCHEVFDLARAQAWTDALDRWCLAQPDVVPFRGECLVHRAEVLQIHGDWSDALEEARRACVSLADDPKSSVTGAAHYRYGELQRLRGNFAEAEVAFHAANDAGKQPQPGLALLWLAQGRIEAAVTAVRRLLGETQQRAPRARLLDVSVDVLLASGEITLAREAACELARIAESVRAPYLNAATARAMGAVLLAENNPLDALVQLRIANRIWLDVGAPFESARTRVLMSHAHRALGDDATADLEVDASRRVFTLLGASEELAKLSRASSGDNTRDANKAAETPLTDREVEVVRLVATGQTNRAIASSLGISEKTVARHISNIFAKLNLASRSAATAYAYEQNLLDRPRAST